MATKRDLARLAKNGVSDPTSNPFAIPADEEIFRYREEEKTKKQEQKIANMNISVADKATFASQMQSTATDEARKLLTEFRTPKAPRPDMNLAAQSTTMDRRKEVQTMAEYIAKKREIFLLQMSLDTKRAEIKKLEERARQREIALKKSEQMLEEDAIRFDAFLKENDEKVQEAIKHAEMEAKAKQDKVLEIKRLNTSIAALRSEMNKYDEQLDDCRKYKEFLDSVTPREWFEQQQQKLQQRKDQMLREWQAQCEALKQRVEAAMAAKAQAEVDYATAKTQQQAERAERAIKETIQNLKEAVKEKEPPPPNLNFDLNPDDEEIFFRDPQQLLLVYKQLEESNLFYIQNAQETEEALEELRAKYRDTRTRMQGETNVLAQEVGKLQMSIATARDRNRRLKDRTIENVGSLSLNIGGQEGADLVSLDQLSVKVAEVYVRCGFDADASIGTLQMLTNIEMKLEEHLSAVDQLPPGTLEAFEKAREKERRKVARNEKLSQQLREHEARMARALERAAAPVFKKSGKLVMFRSKPLQRKKVIREDSRGDDDTELEAYLQQDMI
uniref:DUF4200 domain-containing protein n=1 Tax=Polytomella parva TaxID=51329 RepID=A0A7S0V0D1_9CHLO|mmetsp:Transcript_24583/g.44190  ORF Transcript_24583/g.44190 Transcript_24583/m.44190 type:complete len:558 (+) Transcript_24583:122-1795(+)